jgi:hypothetical protein
LRCYNKASQGATYMESGLQLVLSRHGRHRWHVMANERGTPGPCARAGARLVADDRGGRIILVAGPEP